jgi:hypothetical protein
VSFLWSASRSGTERGERHSTRDVSEAGVWPRYEFNGKVESSFIFGKMIVIGDNMLRLFGIIVEISIRNELVEFVYILIMCHRIYDVMGLHLYVLGDVVNFLFVISYCTSPFIDVTKGVVTYGIRAKFDPRLGIHYGFR